MAKGGRKVGSGSGSGGPVAGGHSGSGGSGGHGWLMGTESGELLEGTLGDDRIKGKGGDDTIRGLDGDDRLESGTGDDTIDGGNGNDDIKAGAGNDTVHGGDGADRIKAQDGDDIVFGGDGADDIHGQDGDDTIDGGAGDDEIKGGGGDDVIDAGAGDDVASGGAHDDTLLGGEGNDLLFGDGAGHGSRGSGSGRGSDGSGSGSASGHGSRGSGSGRGSDGSGTLSVNPGFYDGLGGDESEEIVYSYNVTDGNGGSTQQTATITIDGINDPPVVQADKIFAMAAETGAISLEIPAPTDVDDTSLTITVTGVPNNAVARKADSTVVQNGDALTGSELAGLTIDATDGVGDTTSAFSYTVDDGEAVVPSTVTVRVADGSLADTIQDFSTASTTVEEITASDGASLDVFGSAVALSGDRMIVGASGVDGAANNEGAAYILERDGAGNWNEVEKLTASDDVLNDRLGGSVAIDGDIAIVGALSHDLTPDGNEGSDYIYERNGNGDWVETKLVEPDTECTASRL